MKLCLDQNGVIAQWVLRQIPEAGDFGPCSALGLLGADGSPLAGAVYHQYQPAYRSIMISLAASTPRWATKNTVSMFLRHPFVTWDVHKLRAAILHTNTRSLKLTKGVGFTQEGILKDEFGKGKHAVMLRLFNEDFERLYGQGQSKAA